VTYIDIKVILKVINGPVGLARINLTIIQEALELLVLLEPVLLPKLYKVGVVDYMLCEPEQGPYGHLQYLSKLVLKIF
jgi:hypothetical protein